MILIGNIKHDDDIKYFEQLELLVDDLSINKEVTFKLDIKTEELKDYMNQAIIGLNTIPNGDFNTGQSLLDYTYNHIDFLKILI